MVDSADPGFYGAAWRFTDFCQHLYAGSVYLQLVLKFPRASHDLRRVLLFMLMLVLENRYRAVDSM